MLKVACFALVVALMAAAAQAGALAKAPLAERRAQLGPMHSAASMSFGAHNATAPSALHVLGGPGRKADAMPKMPPEFSNPLKRRRMAMPVIPDGDLGF